MVVTTIPPCLRRGPFTLEQARQHGIGRDVLRGARFRRVLHGVYVLVSIPDTPLLRLDAALLVAPAGSFAVLSSAAAVWRVVDDGDGHPLTPHVGLPPGAPRPRVCGVRWHAHSVLPALRTVHGRPTTAPVATFVALAARRSLRQAVTTGDAMCRRELVSCPTLIAATGPLRAIAGLRARRAAALVRPRVDSPRETLLRLLLVMAGLPEPETNIALCDDQGEPLARVDLAYPSLRVAVEYDGDHHLTRRQRVRDIDRLDVLHRLGWTVVVVVSDHLIRCPEQVLARVRRALVQAGATGLPDRLDPSWRLLEPAW